MTITEGFEVRARPPATAWMAGLLAVAVWGATPAATKYAVADIAPLTVGMLRTVLAGIAVVPALWLLSLPLPGDWRSRGLLAVSTASGFIGFPVLFSLALAHTSTARAALVLAAAPVVTGMLGAAIEKRRPGRSWWAGVVIAMAGEAALILLRGQNHGEATLYGDLLALASCFAVAGGYVAGSRLSPSIGSWSVAAWGAFFGSLILSPLLLLSFALGGTPGAGGVAWAATCWLALFSSLLAYVAWYWALSRGGVGRISTLQFLQPLVTLGLAVLLFSEAMTPGLLVSGAAILFGVAIARRG